MNKKPNDKTKCQPVRHNRVAAICDHVPRYSFRRLARLSEDSGVSKATLSRVLHGRHHPTFPVIVAITKALSKQLGKPLAIDDVFSSDGTYATTFVCGLCNCPGCVPSKAYVNDGELKEEFRDIRPGFSTGDAHELTQTSWQPIEELR